MSGGTVSRAADPALDRRRPSGHGLVGSINRSDPDARECGRRGRPVARVNRAGHRDLAEIARRPRLPSRAEIDRLRAGADRLAGWSFALVGLALPVSTSLGSILAGLAASLALAGGSLPDRLRDAWRQPVAVAALALFAALAAGCLWSAAGPAEAVRVLGKYADLLLIPLLLPLLADTRLRRCAVDGLCLSLGAVLLLSYGVWLELLPEAGWLGPPTSPWVIKMRITYSILMAFGAFLYFQRARSATAPGRRLAWGAASALAAHNVLFMVDSGTGYVVFAVLLAVALAGIAGWRRLTVLAAGTVLVLAAVYAGSTPLQRRAGMVAQELSAWEPGEAQETSVGLRLEFWVNGLRVIAERPVFGHGTGGFAPAYARQVAGTDMVATTNPHNEFLLIAAQLGAPGPILLLALFCAYWRSAARLPGRCDRLTARAAVAAIAAAGLFNAPLLDHTEGLFFAWSAVVFLAGATVRRPETVPDAPVAGPPIAAPPIAAPPIAGGAVARPGGPLPSS